MLIQTENHNIQLASVPNSHVLILGQSGSGKTYASHRIIQETAIKGDKVAIVDLSGSYTETELSKANISMSYSIHDLSTKTYVFPVVCSITDAVDIIADSIKFAFTIQTRAQMVFLKNAIRKVFDGNNNCFTFYNLFVILDEYATGLHSKRDAQNAEDLMEILDSVAEFKNLVIRVCTEINIIIQLEQNRVFGTIDVFELLFLNSSIRKALAEFLLRMIWHVSSRHIGVLWQMIVLDEIQEFKTDQKSTVSQIMREGRKYDFSLLAITQVLPAYHKDTQDALLQAGNILFFKPTPNEMQRVAEMLDSSRKKEIKDILKSLTVGQAVLYGHYTIDGRDKIVSTPILVSVT